MKNSSRNRKFAAPTLAALAVVSLTAFTVFASGPSANPPNNNTDANFNSVTTTKDVTAGGNLATTGNISGGNVTASGNVSGGNVTASGNVSGGNVTASGNVIGNTVSGGTGAAAAGTGGDFKGTSYGVKGTSNSSSNSVGVYGSSTTGNGVVGTTSTASGWGVTGTNSANNGIGIGGQVNAPGTGGIGVFGNASQNNAYGIKGQVAAGKTGGTAGYFANIKSGTSASLGTDTDGLAVSGTTNLQGDIYNSGGSVQVKDTGGMNIIAPGVGVLNALVISGDSTWPGAFTSISNDGAIYTNVVTPANTFTSGLTVTGGKYSGASTGSFIVDNDGETHLHVDEGAGISRLAQDVGGNPNGHEFGIFNDGSLSILTNGNTKSTFNIDTNGVISNPDFGVVKVNDDDGFESDSTTTATMGASVVASNSAQNGKAILAEGGQDANAIEAVGTSSSGTPGIGNAIFAESSGTGDAINAIAPSSSRTIYAGSNTGIGIEAETGQLGSSTGEAGYFHYWGNPSVEKVKLATKNNAIEATGHVKVNGSIGSYNIGTTGTGSCSGSGCHAFASSSCNAGDALVSCGFGGSGWSYTINDSSSSGNTCSVDGTNNAAVSWTLSSYPRCFDPNG